MSISAEAPEPFRLAGHVSAFCATCKRDVFVREDTLQCPNGSHQVEATSLPKMPRVRAQEEASPPAAQQSVSLPKIKQATSWGQATDNLLAALEREEAEATVAFEAARERVKAARRAANALRQIRGLVQVDGVCAVASATTPIPTTQGKSWASKYAACVRCGTTERRHLAKGYCTTCYGHRSDEAVS